MIVSLFLEWFSLTDVPQRAQQNAWICGDGNFSCSAWDTFPIMRVLLVLAALAPIILAYLVITDAKLSWPAGELTTIVGLAAITLIGYNGIVDKPGNAIQEFGISTSYGYWLAMLAAIALVVGGGVRALESRGGSARKPPAT
jgi:glyoxylate carboligase